MLTILLILWFIYVLSATYLTIEFVSFVRKEGRLYLQDAVYGLFIIVTPLLNTWTVAELALMHFITPYIGTVIWRAKK